MAFPNTPFRRILRAAVFGAALAAGIAASPVAPPAASLAAAPARPNVVMLLVDDLGACDFGCTGGRLARTPNIDALAAQGVLFTQAYSAGPVCSPSRAALLTGRSPAALGVTDWIPGDHPKGMPLETPSTRTALPAVVPTIAGALRDAGYRTLSIGKWHLGGTGSLPTDHGFAVNMFGSDAGQPSSYFFPFGKGTTDAWQVRPLPEGAKAGDELTELQGREACARIRAAARDGVPYFLYLPFYAVHAPLQAPEPEVSAMRARAAELGIARAQPTYAAMIERVDATVGQVLRAIEESGATGSTVVILTSDNGGVEGVGDMGSLRGFKGTLYEGGIRVPLVVRWPGVTTAGAHVDAPVTGMDVAATVLDAAGASFAESDRAQVEGRSVRALLASVPLAPPASAASGIAPSADALAAWRARPVFWHYPHYHTPKRPPASAVRIGNWKLIRHDGTAVMELYDLAADPSEHHDLAAQDPARAAAMAATLDHWLAQRSAARARPTAASFSPEAPRSVDP